MRDILSSSWPWYVSGPLIGLFVPALLLFGNRQFGISSNLRHLCAAVAPGRVEFFRYDWRQAGKWNLTFLAGIVVGGIIAARLIGIGDVAIGADTKAALAELGVRSFGGLAPSDLFSWSSLQTIPGVVAIVGGGFLVGFGSAYAGGCTSGHAIAGLAAFERASLLASVAFFAGGIACTYTILPLLF
ncbi:MAG: YeeE/YedE family protein [Gemmatimonadales bacterium]|nr:YeeE/YedE family protein [Gemmatimonadales bacterium]